MFNITATVPDGTSNYGDPRVICKPPGLTDLATFYIGNYFSHAATIISLPGQSGLSVFISIIWALTMPTAGLARGLRVIFGGANLIRGPLQKAQRAGALVMVVRECDVLENYSNKTSRYFLLLSLLLVVVVVVGVVRLETRSNVA